MTTTAKNKSNNKATATTKRKVAQRPNLRKLSPVNTAKSKAVQSPNFEQGEQQFLLLSEIDFSPLNYRKLYSQAALNDFAQELAIHGIISPLTVRKMDSGRYELVAGERRLRASIIAGINEVPVVVKTLTDEQVTEIQLAENLQRENPHPLHESHAVALLQQAGQTIDKIATRLGKSKTFVYSRIKLSELIEPIQEMFIADKLSIKEAFEIAGLAADSQQQFYNEYCDDWRDDDFSTSNLRYIVSRFKTDLNRAPFDTKDKNLVASAGACSRCPFNSATLKSLFPELAKEAVCSNKACYQNKCTAQAEQKIRGLLAAQQPDALLMTAHISPDYKMLIDSLPETAGLPEYSYYDVTVITPPEFPDKEDYLDDEDEDNVKFDENGFNAAVQEYQDNLAAYHDQYDNSENKKGLYINGDRVCMLLFNPEKKKAQTQTESHQKVTAKQVQEAIKSGTVTATLLQQEVERIQTKEERAKEIDQDKIQLKIYEVFKEGLAEGATDQKPTPADLTGARLIIYQSLDYYDKQRAAKALFNDEIEGNEAFYQALANLTDEQYAFLIRLAVAGKSESQYLRTIGGYCLYQMASEAGTDINAIESEQAAKCAEREAKIKPRVTDLENRIQEMQSEAE